MGQHFARVGAAANQTFVVDVLSSMQDPHPKKVFEDDPIPLCSLARVRAPSARVHAALLIRGQDGRARRLVNVEANTGEQGKYDLCFAAIAERTEAILTLYGFVVEANLPPITSHSQ